MEERAAIERIKKEGAERTLRVVVDEKLPNGSLRILVSRLKPDVGDDQKHDSSAWEDEEAHYVDPKNVNKLLQGKQVAKMTEGQVYEIKKGQTADIYSDERERIKAKTKNLLIREGKSKHRTDLERW